jgi:hypothetical protein
MPRCRPCFEVLQLSAIGLSDGRPRTHVVARTPRFRVAKRLRRAAFMLVAINSSPSIYVIDIVEFSHPFSRFFELRFAAGERGSRMRNRRRRKGV